jgi:signal transduction histidine kinase
VGPDHAVLEVKDDGAGFDPAAVSQGGGLGLPGMRERAQQLGADLVVTGMPGEGTRVRIEVPL